MSLNITLKGYSYHGKCSLVTRLWRRQRGRPFLSQGCLKHLQKDLGRLAYGLDMALWCRKLNMLGAYYESVHICATSINESI